MALIDKLMMLASGNSSQSQSDTHKPAATVAGNCQSCKLTSVVFTGGVTAYIYNLQRTKVLERYAAIPLCTCAGVLCAYSVTQLFTKEE